MAHHDTTHQSNTEAPGGSRSRIPTGLVTVAIAGVFAAACSGQVGDAADAHETIDTAIGTAGVEPADRNPAAETTTASTTPSTTIPSTNTVTPTTDSGDENPDADSSTVDLVTEVASSTTNRFAEFAFAPDVAECQLDAAAFEPCTSPVFLPDVGEGAHTFTVRTSADGVNKASVEWEVLDLWDNPTSDLIAATKQPDAAEPNSWRGILRINCDFSHSSYDDPIVFPDQEGAAHLHRFYGNTAVDSTTTLTSLYSSGVSTCQGNELNLSAYWVPALLSPEPAAADGWDVVPAVVGGDDVAHEVFYYSAGVDDLSSIQPIPAGLRIIAGDQSATPDDPQDFSIVRWHCQSWEANDATNPQFSATIPECEAPDRVRMDIFFPSCWNGVDLDSEDHQSHMAYPERDTTGEVVCPDTHPVPVVRPSYHYAFGVLPDVFDPVTRASTGWRLSADSYTVDADNAGGASLHADWFNGWHPSVMEAILETCIQGSLDCHDGNLANGFRLSDVQEGVQNEPEVINNGLGSGHGLH